jgi:hypothetical protein
MPAGLSTTIRSASSNRTVRGDGLGPGRGGDRPGQDEAVKAGLRPRRAVRQARAVTAHRARGDQGLDAGAGQLRQGERQGTVQSAFVAVQADLQHLTRVAGPVVLKVVVVHAPA